MLDHHLMDQSCDLIKETSMASKSPGAHQFSPTNNNCSTNSGTIVSIDSSPSSGYLIDKQSTVLSSSVSSQPVTPLQFSSPLQRQQVAISPISFTSASFKNDFLNRLTVDELIYRIRALEAKNRKLLFENGCLIKDMNGHMTNMIDLKKDNNELRDLCCYLDDERSRAREIAREWESFGDHMSKVLKKEISGYNRKLQQLESKQFELVKENFELKQLCLLLDKAMINKNSIDKSSASRDVVSLNDRHADLARDDNSIVDKESTSGPNKRKSLLNHKVLNYITLLENKLKQYETDRRLLLVNNGESDQQPLKGLDKLKELKPSELDQAMEILSLEHSLSDRQPKDDYANNINSADYAVSEKMYNDAESSSGSVVSEHQKSILKQLCSVAFKKIEDE